jgi:hypothetical protein
MPKTIGDLLRAIGADPSFISRMEHENTQDLIKWCKGMYEAGEAMYDELVTYDDKTDTAKALNAWEQARKLEN